MEKENQVAQIFKTLDVATALKLASIVALSALFIIFMQRVLPWLANRLHGKKRLLLLALVPLIRLLIILTAFSLIVPLLIEPSIQNMVALFGTAGLALGFALKDYASSLIAGIVAIGEKPYRNGDWVKIGGVYGEVCHVGMRTIKVVTADDDKVSIPHSRLWNDPISNANDGTPRLQCVADFYLHPQHDAKQARQTLHDVALTSPYLYFDDPIAVIVQEKPWGTHYRLRAYPVDASQQFRFVSDLTVRGKAALSNLGINFVTFPNLDGQGGPT
jgi:small-conductance mechanosensitive channel